uniref:Uncharacterized protein n=1 Tax=Steinernema glaseri TaxID=37863 RepID=A0A1I7Y5S4_9BILA
MECLPPHYVFNIYKAPRKDWNPGAVVPEASTRSRHHRQKELHEKKRATRKSTWVSCPAPRTWNWQPGAVAAHVTDKKKSSSSQHICGFTVLLLTILFVCLSYI